MAEIVILAKIGGKILSNKKSVDSVISQFENIYKKHYATKIILIPGGGVYADFIRLLDKKLGFSVEQAHWMAIYAMNQNGIELCEKYREFSCEIDFNMIKARSQGLYVFLPYNFLFEIDSLPHSWQVTSDSIAMFIAIKLGLNNCYLIKDVDGLYVKNQSSVVKNITTKKYRELKKKRQLEIQGKQNDEIKKSKPVDDYILTLIDNSQTYCVLLNGASSNKRISAYFTKSNDKKRIYTKISF